MPARVAFVVLSAIMLLACTQSEVVTEETSALPDESSEPGATMASFYSFPSSYFASSTFSPSAPSSAAIGLAAEPGRLAVTGLGMASMTTAPEIYPQRGLEPKLSSYGIASFYRRHSRTANGETFDGREPTAAHRTLPFGTRLRVTNLATRRSVTVRVNDRGPYIPGRIVDLSYYAAEKLGMVGRGVTKVKLEVIE